MHVLFCLFKYTHTLSDGMTGDASSIGYRQLSKSPRIRLHKHLFTSLLLYAILSSLLKINLLLRRSYSPESSTVSSSGDSSNKLDLYCLMLSLSLRYFRSTTYLCMFNEAFYLYQLIRKAFTAPSITPLIIIAYTVPAVMTGTYIATRSLISSSSWTSLTTTITASATTQSPLISSAGLATSDSLISESVTTTTTTTTDDDPCWMLPARDAWKEWIINGPNLCMLLVSISCILLPSYVCSISFLKSPHYTPMTRDMSRCERLYVHWNGIFVRASSHAQMMHTEVHR